MEERGRFAKADIEALPIDEGVVGRLNGKMRALCSERGGPLGNGGADGIGVSREGKARQQHQQGAEDEG